MFDAGRFKDVHYGMIDTAGTRARLFVRELSVVTKVGGDEPVSDAIQLFIVAGQPADGANSHGHKQEPVGVSVFLLQKLLREMTCDRNPRQVVVTQGRVTNVRRYEDFLIGRARNQTFTIGQVAWFQRRVDHHIVGVVFQCLELVVRKAKAPVIVVVRGAVWNQCRLPGQRVQVFLELIEAHLPPDWHTVTHQVKIVVLEIDDSFAGRVFDIGLAYVPLPRHLPVEHPGAGRNLRDFDRYDLVNDCQGLANPVAGNAAANWKQLLDQI